MFKVRYLWHKLIRSGAYGGSHGWGEHLDRKQTHAKQWIDQSGSYVHLYIHVYRYIYIDRYIYVYMYVSTLCVYRNIQTNMYSSTSHTFCRSINIAPKKHPKITHEPDIRKRTGPDLHLTCPVSRFVDDTYRTWYPKYPQTWWSTELGGGKRGT